MIRRREKHTTNMVWKDLKVVQELMIWVTSLVCLWEEADLVAKSKKHALNQSPGKLRFLWPTSTMVKLLKLMLRDKESAQYATELEELMLQLFRLVLDVKEEE